MLTSLAKLCCAALALAPAAVGAQSGVMESPELSRPPTMVLLTERTVAGGKQATGIYEIERDSLLPDVRRVKVWLELPNDLQVRNETIRCSPKTPMRVTNDGRNLIVRQLNPGGAISPGNRLDHLIWWAVCFPELAKQDPATLADKARELGYSGHLQESEQRLPSTGR